jgi:LacI family transcriptional regulator
LIIAIAPTFSMRSAVCDGVCAFLDTRKNWLACLRSPGWSPREEGGQPVTGVICAIETEARAEQVNTWAVPVVDIFGQFPQPRIATVTYDNHAIGEMAAAHFLQRGYASLAYAGVAGRKFSVERMERFIQAATTAGATTACHMADQAFWRLSWAKRQETLGQWLTDLEKPVGVLAVADWWAATVMEAALLEGLSIPSEVAIVGVDHDSTFKTLIRPGLSSIDPDAGQRGFQAASLIERMASGAAPEHIRIPPLRVIECASTAGYVMQDRRVAVAVQFIQDNASEPIDVQDVADEAGMSRRSLEQRFKKATGQTVHTAIWSAHLARAQYLLRATDLSVLDVALRSGFASHSSFTTYFKRKTGRTPKEFRQNPGADRAEGAQS